MEAIQSFVLAAALSFPAAPQPLAASLRDSVLSPDPAAAALRACLGAERLSALASIVRMDPAIEAHRVALGAMTQHLPAGFQENLGAYRREPGEARAKELGAQWASAYDRGARAVEEALAPRFERLAQAAASGALEARDLEAVLDSLEPYRLYGPAVASRLERLRRACAARRSEGLLRSARETAAGILGARLAEEAAVGSAPAGGGRPPGAPTVPATPTRNEWLRRGAAMRAPTIEEELRIQDLRIRGGVVAGPDYRSELWHRGKPYEGPVPEELRGSVAVVFHGNRRTPEELKATIDALKARGFDWVYASLGPGIGKQRSLLGLRFYSSSEMPDASHPGEDIAHVDAVMARAAALHRPGAPFGVVGQSRGGAQAFVAAARNPDRVTAVVLDSPFFGKAGPLNNLAEFFTKAIEKSPGRLAARIMDRIPLPDRQMRFVARRLLSKLTFGRARAPAEPHPGALQPMSLGHGYAVLKLALDARRMLEGYRGPRVQIFASANDKATMEGMLFARSRLAASGAPVHWKEFTEPDIPHGLADWRASRLAADVGRWTAAFLLGEDGWLDSTTRTKFAW